MPEISCIGFEGFVTIIWICYRGFWLINGKAVHARKYFNKELKKCNYCGVKNFGNKLVLFEMRNIVCYHQIYSSFKMSHVILDGCTYFCTFYNNNSKLVGQENFWQKQSASLPLSQCLCKFSGKWIRSSETNAPFNFKNTFQSLSIWKHALWICPHNLIIILYFYCFGYSA